MINVLFLDFDGTMTNGDILCLEDGTQLKAYNAKDGMAIRAATLQGLQVIILTGNPLSNGLKERMFTIGVSLILTDVRDKAAAIRDLNLKHGWAPDEIAFMGDDMNDVEAMGLARIAGAPADATNEALNRANFIARSPGGRGAVREFIDYIMMSRVS